MIGPDGLEERTAWYEERFERDIDEQDVREQLADDLNITPVRCLVHGHQYFNGFCLRCGSDAMLDIAVAV